MVLNISLEDSRFWTEWKKAVSSHSLSSVLSFCDATTIFSLGALTKPRSSPGLSTALQYLQLPRLLYLVLIKGGIRICTCAFDGLIMTRVNRSTRRKTCRIATLSTTNPTRAGLSLNLGRCCERIDRLSLLQSEVHLNVNTIDRLMSWLALSTELLYCNGQPDWAAWCGEGHRVPGPD